MFADELLATSQPSLGTMPPNRVCAAPPTVTVPLPSTAAEPAVLMTGNGAVTLTGVATPPTIAAGACSGTRLPTLSSPVDSACVVVFASLTNSVIGELLRNGGACGQSPGFRRGRSANWPLSRR